MSLLEINDLSHSFGDKTLYRDAAFSLYKGEHIGVVGSNGAGKSTLIGICTGEIIPDRGRVVWQPGVRMGHLDQYAAAKGGQTILQFLRSAFAQLYALEQEMTRLYAQAADGGHDDAAFTQAASCQGRLEALDFYSIDLRIEKTAFGLGLDALGLDRPLAELSGGQRAKTVLAKLLLEDADVLLLDEPTNFLDQEHVAWLAGELAASSKAFLVVSHDTAFLDKIAGSICDIDNGEIRKYSGAYTEFLRQKQHLREDYVRRYQTQQREIKKTEEYIRRNIAGVNSKNAKGRRKQLAHVQRMAAPEFALSHPVFEFDGASPAAQEHLLLQNLCVGYTDPLLSGLNLTVEGGQRVVLTGFNGIGKSTLLKTLVGQLPTLGGGFRFSKTAALGYYEQELRWPDGDGERTPLELVALACPSLGPKEVRRQLSRCGISREHALQPVGTLSGGEQAKVRLCLLTTRPCDFLILDEPTNHLDREAKAALAQALQRFPGTVLLVTHEADFYQGWATRVIPIEEMRGLDYAAK